MIITRLIRLSYTCLQNMALRELIHRAGMGKRKADSPTLNTEITGCRTFVAGKKL